jgi:hypothetical protein
MAASPNIAETESSGPSIQAYRILHVGFTVLPIVEGIDKFTHLLMNWDQYLAPLIGGFMGAHVPDAGRGCGGNRCGYTRSAAAKMGRLCRDALVMGNHFRSTPDSYVL